MKVRALITGSTGMVGEGVLHEALNHPDVEGVIAVNRRPCGVTHPKLTEIIHTDFFDLSQIEHRLTDLNACFFCLGISSLNASPEKYYSVTYTLTINFAERIARQNPGLAFCYVSGAGTDSSEKGMIRWARVKGKTENDLMKIFPGKAYSFRPGFMLPSPAARNIPSYFRAVNSIYPLLHTLFPGYSCTLAEVGVAMINCVTSGYEKQVLDVKDIVALAKR